MSTDKECPSWDATPNSAVYYGMGTGRLSPSSWDDSDDDRLSDTNSSLNCGESTRKPNDFERGPAGEGEVSVGSEDRRQSLARVKRRTRSCSSSMADSYRSCSMEPVNSPEMDCTGSAGDSLRLDRDWDEWDLDGVIFDIENYLNEQSLSLIRCKVLRPEVTASQSNPSRTSVLSTGMTSEDYGSHRYSFNSKLSRILEVEESKSSTSVKSMETSRSTAHLQTQMDDPIRDPLQPNDLSSGRFLRVEQARSDAGQGKSASSDGNESSREGAVPVKLSTDQNITEIYSDESCDSDRMWDRIRSRIKNKNSEYALNHEESEYVTNSLKYIFPGEEVRPGLLKSRNKSLTFGSELVSRESSAETERIFGRDHCEGFLSGRTSAKSVNSFETEDGSVCMDRTDGHKAGLGGTNSSGRTTSGPSKGSVDLGLDTLFCPSNSSSPLCSPKKDFGGLSNGSRCTYTSLRGDKDFNYKNVLPRSGREAFLTSRDVSGGSINSKTGKSNSNGDSKRSNTSSPEDWTYYDDNVRQVRGDEPKKEVSSEEDFCSERKSFDFPDKESSGKPKTSSEKGFGDNLQNGLDGTVQNGDSNPSSSGKESHREGRAKDGSGPVREGGRSSGCSKQSTSTLRSKILLDLELSDNDDKCSTTERKMFGDMVCEVDNSTGNGTNAGCGNVEGGHLASSKSPSIDEKQTETGRSAITRSSRAEHNTYSGKNRVSLFECDPLGIGDFGDSKWNIGKYDKNHMGFPLDRGDANYENYNIATEWRKLVVHFDDSPRTKHRKPIDSVFWIGTEGSLTPHSVEECWHTEEESLRKRRYIGDGKQKKSFARCKWSVTSNKLTHSIARSSEASKRVKYDKMRGRKRNRQGSYIGDALLSTGCYDGGNTLRRVKPLGFYLCPDRNGVDRLVDRQTNWLVNKLRKNEDVLTRERRLIQKSDVARESGDGSWEKKSGDRNSTTLISTPHLSDGSPGCFRSLFKYFVNIFTVFIPKRRK